MPLRLTRMSAGYAGPVASAAAVRAGWPLPGTNAPSSAGRLHGPMLVEAAVPAGASIEAVNMSLAFDQLPGFKRPDRV